MLDIPYAQFKKCCACEPTFRNKKYIHSIGESTIKRTRIIFNNNQIQVNDLICGNCRTKAYQNKKKFKSSKVDVDESSIVDDDSYTSNKNDADDDIDVEIEDLELLNSSNIDANNVNHTSNNQKEKIEHIGVEKNKIELFKAASTHKHCIMCKKKTGLHVIKIESVIFAYKYYGTIINKDSRCCSSHFESNGDIKEKDFKRIKKTIHSFD
jgi:predicted nucleic acid-binding Zn ribbon protein